MMQGRRPPVRRPIRVGRETKLTPELAKKICDLIRGGNHLSVAARANGVAEETVNIWIRKGRGEDPSVPRSAMYRQFAADVDSALAGGEATAVLHWRSAFPKDWHASRDWLRTMYPERWAQDVNSQQSAAAAAAVNVTVNTGNGRQGQEALSMSLEDLIASDPRVLKAAMPLFDTVDAIFGGQPAEQEEVRQLPANGTYESEEVIEGTYTPIDRSNGHAEVDDDIFDAFDD